MNGYRAFLLVMAGWITLTQCMDRDNCPAFCKCKLKDFFARCLNKYGKLRQVPNLPTYVRKLYLDSNEIPIMNNLTFYNPSLENLTLLSMKSCQLSFIEKNTFGNLMHLETLDLGSNVKLNISSLKLALRSMKKKELRTLSFDYMNWTTQKLSMRIFEHLAGHKVKALTLKGNKIQSWSDTASLGIDRLSKLYISENQISTCDHLSSLTSLGHIDLSNNLLARCDMKMLPKSLVSISLSYNKLRKFPKFCSDDGKIILLPHLEVLHLEHNKINTIIRILNPCFPSLTHLYLGGNDIKRFPIRAFSYLTSLLVLRLDKMQRGVKVIERGAFDIPSLRELTFRQNKFSFKSKTKLHSISFRACKQLEILDLSYNKMPSSSTDLRQLFLGLHKLRQLRLENVRWTAIPEKLFEMFPNIEKVSFSHNGISKIDRNLFPEKIQLQVLYLNHNGFSSLSSMDFPKSFWKFVKRIDLSGNPYSCNCNLLWFQKKLISSSSLFHQYPKKYICASPTELRGIELRKFNVTDKDCQIEPLNSVLLMTLSSTISICVFAGLVALFLYLARWHIRYWIYLLRYKRSGLTRNYGDDHDYKYDVFVSYAQEDGDFVHNVLLNKLENENGYRLCIHARDFEAGRMIVDNIAENITSSRQVLLVMSESFCRSKWCKFEQLIALDRWLNNESEPIVIIMLEEIHSKNMNKDIKILLSTTTYVQWTLNDTAKEVFWNHLLASLKR